MDKRRIREAHYLRQPPKYAGPSIVHTQSERIISYFTPKDKESFEQLLNLMKREKEDFFGPYENREDTHYEVMIDTRDFKFSKTMGLYKTCSGDDLTPVYFYEREISENTYQKEPLMTKDQFEQITNDHVEKKECTDRLSEDITNMRNGKLQYVTYWRESDWFVCDYPEDFGEEDNEDGESYVVFIVDLTLDQETKHMIMPYLKRGSNKFLSYCHETEHPNIPTGRKGYYPFLSYY